MAHDIWKAVPEVRRVSQPVRVLRRRPRGDTDPPAGRSPATGGCSRGSGDRPVRGQVAAARHPLILLAGTAGRSRDAHPNTYRLEGSYSSRLSAWTRGGCVVD